MGHIHPGFILAERYPGRIERGDRPRFFPLLLRPICCVCICIRPHMSDRDHLHLRRRARDVRNGKMSRLSLAFFFSSRGFRPRGCREPRRVDYARFFAMRRSRAGDCARRKLCALPIYQKSDRALLMNCADDRVARN